MGVFMVGLVLYLIRVVIFQGNTGKDGNEEKEITN